MSKLTYEKGKPMKEKGIIPSIKEKARNAINFTINLGGRAIDKVEGKMKEREQFTKDRDDKMKTENWGSPEGYENTKKDKVEDKEFVRKSKTPIKKRI